MQDLTGSQKARVAVRNFKTIANALALRGYFRPSGKMGQALADCLVALSPEIYGSMNDPRVVELKGLEYVIDRLPRSIEKATRLILTEEEQFSAPSFEEIFALKRRRSCYRISETEICFVITRGLSEIYDILTHLSFLNIEAKKIRNRMTDEYGNFTIEWQALDDAMGKLDSMDDRQLDKAIWNLSLILGRSYQETRHTYEYLEGNRIQANSNSGLFEIVYHLGTRVYREKLAAENYLIVYMTPSLINVISHQRYGQKWSGDIKRRLKALGLDRRPLHIISANLHSVVNLVYGYAAAKECRIAPENEHDPLYSFILCICNQKAEIIDYALEHGLYELPDQSGAHIDCQIIDTAQLDAVPMHPEVKLSPSTGEDAPVILVMDYAFGAQAFEVMDCLLNPFPENPEQPTENPINVASISIMGKAGILTGSKGEIMLATAHVIEGTSDNYMFENDLDAADFDADMPVHAGPMITVLGTSLQNRDMLLRFRHSWRTVGLEMEGGHYQRAISAAIIKGHIPRDVKIRYVYYASDNPLESGQTLAAGEMGPEGIRPTYMATKVILERIL
ncbi:MAG: hypothetical protein R6T92_07500 [Desulfosalsimonadaceae bacterium]